MTVMRLRLFFLLLGARLRLVLRYPDGAVAGWLLALLAAAMMIAGFAEAVILVRQGPCSRHLTSSGGHPHWLLSCRGSGP